MDSYTHHRFMITRLSLTLTSQPCANSMWFSNSRGGSRIVCRRRTQNPQICQIFPKTAWNNRHGDGDLQVKRPFYDKKKWRTWVLTIPVWVGRNPVKVVPRKLNIFVRSGRMCWDRPPLGSTTDDIKWIDNMGHLEDTQKYFKLSITNSHFT